MNRIFESSVTISPDVLFQEINGETVLLDLRSEAYFGLDEVGTRLWQLLQHERELVAIHAVMVEEYEVNSDQLKQDLARHIQELETAGLVSLSKHEA